MWPPASVVIGCIGSSYWFEVQVPDIFVLALGSYPLRLVLPIPNSPFVGEVSDAWPVDNGQIADVIIASLLKYVVSSPILYGAPSLFSPRINNWRAPNAHCTTTFVLRSNALCCAILCTLSVVKHCMYYSTRVHHVEEEGSLFPVEWRKP